MEDWVLTRAIGMFTCTNRGGESAALDYVLAQSDFLTEATKLRNGMIIVRVEEMNFQHRDYFKWIFPGNNISFFNNKKKSFSCHSLAIETGRYQS